jgi:hypothetical protein
MMTWAPSLQKRSAIPNPIPLEPPVTIATLPSSSPDINEALTPD